MCGIFGYVGKKDAVKLAIEGLKRLEYRGYDSAGIAGLKNGLVCCEKEAGKVAVLENRVKENGLTLDLAIAHTRWATHGVPNNVNAHPHYDKDESLAVVHNGIIENHVELRKMLQKKGYVFTSETDSEVVAHLISSYYQGDLLKAVKEALPHLVGSYALALCHRNHPSTIVAIAHESPLVIGIGTDEMLLSSDPNTLASYTHDVVFLSNSEIAVLTPGKMEVYSSQMQVIEKAREKLQVTSQDVEKGSFDHFTLKEIYDQPQAIRNATLSRILEDYGTAAFEEMTLTADDLIGVERVLIIGCGTSWHAGFLTALLMEDLARIPAQVEVASEFRYKNPVVAQGTFVIAISQSGETADTLAAVRELKAKGAKVLAACNVLGSTLSREADSTLYLRAGPEIGVCSTKAFTNQVVVLGLFTLLLARMRNLSKGDGKRILKALKTLPDHVQRVLESAAHIEAIAKKYSHYQNFFFLGRRYMYPTCMEGALKLKEISYINANAYPAGEMKHGPIALISEDCPTVAFCANKATYDKLLSNLMEVKARKGKVIAIAEAGQQGLEGIADELITVPATLDEFSSIPSSVAAQLFAYYIARERGADIDQPRNLAKSVTVE